MMPLVRFRRAANFRRGSHDPRAYTMMTTKVIHDWSSEHIAKLKKPEQSGERLVLVLGAPHSGAEQLAQMLGQFDDVAVVGPVESLVDDLYSASQCSPGRASPGSV